MVDGLLLLAMAVLIFVEVRKNGKKNEKNFQREKVESNNVSFYLSYAIAIVAFIRGLMMIISGLF